MQQAIRQRGDHVYQNTGNYIADLRYNLKRLSGMTTEGMAAIQETVDFLESDLALVNAKIKSMSAQIATLNSEVAALDKWAKAQGGPLWISRLRRNWLTSGTSWDS